MSDQLNATLFTHPNDMPRDFDSIIAYAQRRREALCAYLDGDREPWTLGEFLHAFYGLIYLKGLVEWAGITYDDCGPRKEEYTALQLEIQQRTRVYLQDASIMDYVRQSADAAGRPAIYRKYAALARQEGVGLNQAAQRVLGLLNDAATTETNEADEATKTLRQIEVATLPYGLSRELVLEVPALAQYVDPKNGMLTFSAKNMFIALTLIPRQDVREWVFRNLHQGRQQMVDLAIRHINTRRGTAAVLNQEYSEQHSWAGWQLNASGLAEADFGDLLNQASASINEAAAGELEEWKRLHGLAAVYLSDLFYLKQATLAQLSGEEEQLIPLETLFAGVKISLNTMLDLDVEIAKWEKGYTQGLWLMTIRDGQRESFIILDLLSRDTKEAHGYNWSLQISGVRISVINMTLSPDNPMLSGEEVDTLYHEIGHGLQLSLAPVEFVEATLDYASTDVEVLSLLMERLAGWAVVREPLGLPVRDSRLALIGEALTWSRQVALAQAYFELFTLPYDVDITPDLVDRIIVKYGAGAFDNPPMQLPAGLVGTVHFYNSAYESLYGAYVVSRTLEAAIESNLLLEGFGSLRALFEAGNLDESYPRTLEGVLGQLDLTALARELKGVYLNQ